MDTWPWLNLLWREEGGGQERCHSVPAVSHWAAFAPQGEAKPSGLAPQCSAAHQGLLEPGDVYWVSERANEPVPALPSSCNCPSRSGPGTGTQSGSDFRGFVPTLGTTQRCIISLDLQVVTECLRASMWAVNQSMYHTDGHGPGMETVGGPSSLRRRGDRWCVGAGRRGDSPLWLQSALWQWLAWGPIAGRFLAHPLHGVQCQEIPQHAEDAHSLKKLNPVGFNHWSNLLFYKYRKYI